MITFGTSNFFLNSNFSKREADGTSNFWVTAENDRIQENQLDQSNLFFGV